MEAIECQEGKWNVIYSSLISLVLLNAQSWFLWGPSNTWFEWKTLRLGKNNYIYFDYSERHFMLIINVLCFEKVTI